MTRPSLGKALLEPCGRDARGFCKRGRNCELGQIARCSAGAMPLSIVIHAVACSGRSHVGALHRVEGNAMSGRQSDPADRAPLLRWMIFTGLCVFAAVLLWHYGLVRQMLA